MPRHARWRPLRPSATSLRIIGLVLASCPYSAYRSKNNIAYTSPWRPLAHLRRAWLRARAGSASAGVRLSGGDMLGARRMGEDACCGVASRLFFLIVDLAYTSLRSPAVSLAAAAAHRRRVQQQVRRNARSVRAAPRRAPDAQLDARRGPMCSVCLRACVCSCVSGAPFLRPYA